MYKIEQLLSTLLSYVEKIVSRRIKNKFHASYFLINFHINSERVMIRAYIIKEDGEKERSIKSPIREMIKSENVLTTMATKSNFVFISYSDVTIEPLD